MFKLFKLLFHNFKKYALKDIRYFKLFVKVIFKTLFQIRGVLKLRKPLKMSTFLKIKQLNPFFYS